MVTDGRWLSGGGEVVLDAGYARTLDLAVGQTVTLRGVDGPEPFTVVGLWVLARDAAYPDRQPGEGFVGRADLERLQPDQSTWWWSQAVRFASPAESGCGGAGRAEPAAGRRGGADLGQPSG